MNSNNLKQKVSHKKHGLQFKDQSLEYAKKSKVFLRQQKIEQAEFTRLKRKNIWLADENSFLKKAAAYFSKESK